MNSALLLFILRLFLALILYVFLVLAFLTLWKDIRGAAVEPSSIPQAWLVLSENGEPVALQPETTIGRAADNSLHLKDETVSAYHARLSYQHGQWILEDAGSRNGTHVNGLTVDRAFVIADGDILEFGSVLVTFSMQKGLHMERPHSPG